MKKLLLVLVAVVLAVLAFLYYRRGKAHAEQVAAWLPASTSIFEDLPDLHRTEKRWPATALAQILAEPQVQAFLEKPRSTMPRHEEVDKRVDQLKKIDPTQFFLAVTSTGVGEKAEPQLLLGLAYDGSKDELQSLVGELRQAVQKGFPAGKSDVVTYGSGEIETFTYNGTSEGLAYRDKWLLVSSDLGVLKAALDGCDGKATPGALADSDDFKKCLAEMPADADNLAFVQPKLMANSFGSLMMMLQPTGDLHQLDYLEKMGSYALATKLDGALVRESAFVLQSAAASAPLASNALTISTADTVIFADGSGQKFDAVSSQLQTQMAPLMPMIEPYLKAFQAQGLSLDSFTHAFGPENAFLLNWADGTPMPAPFISIDVRDGAKAQKFLDSLAALPSDGPVHFERQQSNGIVTYSMPATSVGFFPLQFTLGLTDKILIGGLTKDAVTAAVKRAAGPGTLAGSAAYQEAMKMVQAPTQGYAYVDTKSIFEHIYNLVRGVAALGLIPHSGDFLDMSKLPETATISNHLSPLVVSNSTVAGGLLTQSVGPLSPWEAAGFVGVMAGVGGFEYAMQTRHPGFTPSMPSPGVVPPAGAPAAPVPPLAPMPPAAPAPPAAPIPGANPSTSPSGTSL